MADQGNVQIGLEAQNKVAEAIYLRWYRNGHRHPRPIIVQAGRCYRADNRKHVAAIWVCVCPACRMSHGIIQTGRPNLNRAIRNWNYWTTHKEKKNR